MGHFVVRLGGFRILEMFWKILGKRCGDAGSMDLFIELKVFGLYTAKVIMTGKNYKRCPLAHKLMHEVMSRMQWAAFLEWAVSKKLISKKKASKLEMLVNQVKKRDEKPS